MNTPPQRQPPAISNSTPAHRPRRWTPTQKHCTRHDDPELKCFSCGEQGHFKHDCPHLQQQQQQQQQQPQQQRPVQEPAISANLGHNQVESLRNACLTAIRSLDTHPIITAHRYLCKAFELLDLFLQPALPATPAS